jgi:alkanesulfonate monooxygenase SsuD/methylene tetrahydromethanopterin reductase-like flavin-dependent oxidoreductase (luciferase family)
VQSFRGLSDELSPFPAQEDFESPIAVEHDSRRVIGDDDRIGDALDDAAQGRRVDPHASVPVILAGRADKAQKTLLWSGIRGNAQEEYRTGKSVPAPRAKDQIDRHGFPSRLDPREKSTYALASGLALGEFGKSQAYDIGLGETGTSEETIARADDSKVAVEQDAAIVGTPERCIEQGR